MEVHYGIKELPKFNNAVITIGSFDGVHCGHQKILERILELANEINGESVVITFDPHPRHVLQPENHNLKLLNTTSEKIQLLQKSGIHHVVIVPFTLNFAQLSPDDYIENFLCQLFNPKIIVIGYDHRFGTSRKGDINYLKQFEKTKGFQIYEIEKEMVDEMEVSSTIIRTSLERGDIDTANKLLGYQYVISGKVVRGDQIGRQIGFPTANISPANISKLIPREGIYACEIVSRHVKYQGMLYIGRRPTVHKGNQQVIEVNIFDFNEDIYEEEVAVSVLYHIREDMQLPSLEALQHQISLDKEMALSYFKKKSLILQTAIVILNYNTRHQLEQFLPAVIRHSSLPGVRIIVADNGSTDDSVFWLETHLPEIEIIRLKRNFGFAEGYNQALKNIEADIFVLLNSDVEVAPNWISPILESFKTDKTIAAIQPKILSFHRKEYFEYAGAAGGWTDMLGYPFCKGRIFDHVEKDTGQYNQKEEIFWASGAAMFIRAELFRKFNGFDGDYFAHLEEIDLCQRLKMAGYSIMVNSEAVVYHVGGGTLNYQHPRKTYLNFRNSWTTTLKNEPTSKLLWLIPARLILDFVAALFFLLKKEVPQAASIFKALFYNIRHFGTILKKRKMVHETIRNNRTGPNNKAGVFNGSIVFQYFIKKIRLFSDLIP